MCKLIRKIKKYFGLNKEIQTSIIPPSCYTYRITYLILAKDLKRGDLIKLEENSPATWEVVRLGFPIYPKFKTYITLHSIDTSVKGDSGAAVRGCTFIEDIEKVWLIERKEP